MREDPHWRAVVALAVSVLAVWIEAPAEQAPEAEAAAPGALAGVSHIQRLNTRGGLAPADTCVNQQSVRVAYTADYLFFRSQP